MDTRRKLLCAAEALFDRHGFTATGMGRLTRAADMSSRTLYKHAGSKADLIVAVLAERQQRFLRAIRVQSVEALFAALETWVRREGGRGCLFLRAYGETGGDAPEIAQAVSTYKAELFDTIEKIVSAETGGAHQPELAEQILVLFEGATWAAVYRGTGAINAARQAAVALIQQARP